MPQDKLSAERTSRIHQFLKQGGTKGICAAEVFLDNLHTNPKVDPHVPWYSLMVDHHANEPEFEKATPQRSRALAWYRTGAAGRVWAKGIRIGSNFDEDDQGRLDLSSCTNNNDSTSLVRFSVHGAPRGVATVKAVDVLLQLLDHYSATGSVAGMAVVVGKGGGSGTGNTSGSTPNKTSFESTEPVIKGSMLKLFNERLNPPLDAVVNNKNKGELKVSAKRLQAWFDGEQAKSWQSS